MKHTAAAHSSQQQKKKTYSTVQRVQLQLSTPKPTAQPGWTLMSLENSLTTMPTQLTRSVMMMTKQRDHFITHTALSYLKRNVVEEGAKR